MTYLKLKTLSKMIRLLTDKQFKKFWHWKYKFLLKMVFSSCASNPVISLLTWELTLSFQGQNYPSPSFQYCPEMKLCDTRISGPYGHLILAQSWKELIVARADISLKLRTFLVRNHALMSKFWNWLVKVEENQAFKSPWQPQIVILGLE